MNVNSAVPDHHPRYVVREITGHSGGSGPRTPSTSIRVADSWYCWWSVQEWPSEKFNGQRTYAMCRAWADALCAELNAEHDAWLAAG